MRKIACFLFCWMSCCWGYLPAATAQDAGQEGQNNMPPDPKAALRYEIDAKRIGVSDNSEDALPRSREFLRIDSTYYVGWLLEGAYKYNHAADYLGYRNAAVPLARALQLMERDFKKELRTRSSDLMAYYPAYRYQVDYTRIAYYLLQCYLNMEDPEKANTLLRRVLQWNLQRDLYLDVYNYLSWLVHRNRFYTAAQYSFLKNSIDENEALANRYLDSGLRRIQRNKPLNAAIFPPGYEVQDIMSAYHYKCILHSYSFHIDSALYYFNAMRRAGYLPHNNYANFRSICGDFREAEKEYRAAAAQEGGDKRLKEYVYYTSVLDIYKSRPKAGMALLQDMIRANGSTPGFGWYNIALARCMFYDGQIAESKRYAGKAENFKELHIGTTLGQSHYDFSVQLNKLICLNASWEMQRFENKNWWYNPAALGNMAQISTEKYMQQFLLINQFAHNPERDRVIYKLFSTESTVAWDEIWYLIQDYSTHFFIKRFEQEVQTDVRKYIRKYFRYFLARLYMKQADYRKAQGVLQEILQDPDFDTEYEQLLWARVYESQALCAQALKNTEECAEHLYRLYTAYPQLVPFTGLEMNMRLHVSGTVDQELVNRLKKCNINWVTGSISTAVDAYLVFGNGADKSKRVTYFVLDASGNYLVQKQALNYKKSPETALQIAYRLFNIGGKEATVEKE